MEALSRMVIGLGTGSFVCLLSVLLSGGAYLNQADVGACFAISAVAGVATLLFSIQRLSYLTCLVLHYLVVMSFAFTLFQLVEPVADARAFAASATAFYVISYAASFIREVLTSRRLNQMIARAHAGRAEEDDVR